MKSIRPPIVFFLTGPLSDNSFSEICGLEHCCMLTHLNLAHNKISQISGLDCLPLIHLCLVGLPLLQSLLSGACTLTRKYSHTRAQLVQWLFVLSARHQQFYLPPSLSL